MRRFLTLIDMRRQPQDDPAVESATRPTTEMVGTSHVGHQRRPTLYVGFIPADRESHCSKPHLAKRLASRDIWKLHREIGWDLVLAQPQCDELR